RAAHARGLHGDDDLAGPRRGIRKRAEFDFPVPQENGAAHQRRFLKSALRSSVMVPLPWNFDSSTTSPRKFSSMVTSSGSLRKIWNSLASGKLRTCRATLFRLM